MWIYNERIEKRLSAMVYKFECDFQSAYPNTKKTGNKTT